MRGLGKLITALNPLDASMMNQMGKAMSGQSMFRRGLNYAKAGAKQIAGGGYFRGISASASGGLSPRGPGNAAIRRTAANSRLAVAGIGAAWAGLNFLAPNSGLTSMANYGMVIGGAAAAGPGVQAKFGNRGRNIMYGGVGGVLGAKMFGVI